MIGNKISGSSAWTSVRTASSGGIMERTRLGKATEPELKRNTLRTEEQNKMLNHPKKNE